MFSIVLYFILLIVSTPPPLPLARCDGPDDGAVIQDEMDEMVDRIARGHELKNLAHGHGHGMALCSIRAGCRVQAKLRFEGGGKLCSTDISI